MVVVCPDCKKEHHIDEKMIPPNVKVARCRSCGARFSLSPAGQMPEKGVAEDASKEMRPRTIAVALSKGGVGKTTTSVNLAAGLAHAGFNVLLVATDTQGQEAYMLGDKPNPGLPEL